MFASKINCKGSASVNDTHTSYCKCNYSMFDQRKPLALHYTSAVLSVRDAFTIQKAICI